MTEVFKTLGQTVLAEDLDASEVSVDVVSAAALRGSFSSGDTYSVVVDNEIMDVTAESGNTLILTRGADFTTAAIHANGAVVKQIVTARTLNRLKVDANIPGLSGNCSVTRLGGPGVTLNGSNGGAFQATGLTVTLPTAGVYLLFFVQSLYVDNASGTTYLVSQLQNTTDAEIVGDTDVLSGYTSGAVLNAYQSSSCFATYTCPGASRVIELQIQRNFSGAITVSQLTSNGSRLGFLKLSN